MTGLPRALGFGISRPEHVAVLAGHCEAVVVASALLDAIERGGADPGATAEAFVRGLRGAGAGSLTSTSHVALTPVNLEPVFRLDGEVRVPGDKSISHRALILGALARGRTYLGGLAPGDDVARTASCLEACGVHVRVHDDGRAMVEGDGPERALSAPAAPLDCGNSGSSMRMLAGALAGHPMTASLDGDASLRRRPMRRVATPLQEMGAAVRLSRDGTAPMIIDGRRPLAGSPSSRRWRAPRSRRRCCSPGSSPTGRPRSSSRRPPVTTPSVSSSSAGSRWPAARVG